MRINSFTRMGSIIAAAGLMLVWNNVSFAQKKTGIRDITSPVFRAAVIKTNITPTTPQWLRGYNPRQSTGVLDSLYTG